MKEVEEKELEKVEGGISVWAAIGIGAAIVFAIGAVDGYIRPLKCNMAAKRAKNKK